MSTVLEQTPAVPADPPAPSSRSGSLLRAELHRFRSRRFLQVLLGLCVLGWIVATIIALTQFGVPTDDDRPTRAPRSTASSPTTRSSGSSAWTTRRSSTAARCPRAQRRRSSAGRR